jgi:hypothetical protein
LASAWRITVASTTSGSCSNVPAKINVIIGRNNCGKSNVLPGPGQTRPVGGGWPQPGQQAVAEVVRNNSVTLVLSRTTPSRDTTTEAGNSASGSTSRPFLTVSREVRWDSLARCTDFTKSAEEPCLLADYQCPVEDKERAWPEAPGVKLHNLTTVWLNGKAGSEITHVVNDAMRQTLVEFGGAPRQEVT